MHYSERFALLDKYRYLAEQISNEFYNGEIELDTIMNHAIDGLMRAINSMESIKQTEEMDFKEYASVHIRSEIDRECYDCKYMIYRN